MTTSPFIIVFPSKAFPWGVKVPEDPFGPKFVRTMNTLGSRRVAQQFRSRSEEYYNKKARKFNKSGCDASEAKSLAPRQSPLLAVPVCYRAENGNHVNASESCRRSMKNGGYSGV